MSRGMASRVSLRALRRAVVTSGIANGGERAVTPFRATSRFLDEISTSSMPPSFPVHNYSLSPCFQFTRSRLFSKVGGASSKVVLLKDDMHYEEIMKELKSKQTLGVLYFTAQWCGPCKQIAPYLDELSNQFEDVMFIKLDVDKLEVEETMKNSHIGVVPTFHFYKGGKRIGELTGAVKDKLKSLVETLRSES